MNARTLPVLALLAVTMGVTLPGCRSKEQEARERARLELEEKSRREAEAANRAITDLNRKMFGRKPATPPAETPKPDDRNSAPAPAKK